MRSALSSTFICCFLVFVADDPFARRDDLLVEGLGWPTDMVANPRLNCVYIGDRYGIKPDKPGLFIVTAAGNPTHHRLDVTPAGMSLTSDQHLLVVCEHDKRGRSLRFFRGERTSGTVELVELEEQRIVLQLERYLLQAAEVSGNLKRFVVSQVHKSRGVHRIVVVDNSGTEVRLGQLSHVLLCSTAILLSNNNNNNNNHNLCHLHYPHQIT